MARRTFAFVNREQNSDRLNRALLREETLQNNGASGVQVERARHKTDGVLAADDVLRGRSGRRARDLN